MSSFLLNIFFVYDIIFSDCMKNNESRENYLETILILSNEKPVVRSVDIAEKLGFQKPSICVAVKNLKEENLITVSKEGYISLTKSGKKIAENIYDRHTTITKMLVRLGVSEKAAEQDACRIEHVISEETFSAIKKHGIQKDTVL